MILLSIVCVSMLLEQNLVRRVETGYDELFEPEKTVHSMRFRIAKCGFPRLTPSAFGLQQNQKAASSRTYITLHHL